VAVAGGIVLAGGRSERMGTPKAGLPWHGSTLLRRTTGVLARSAGGPVIVVRAPGQPLPLLPGDIEVVDDPADGLGPLQGIATGLTIAAKLGLAATFVCATDMPFLHPRFVRRVLDALEEPTEVVLPDARGHHQPLAAAYRTSLVPLLNERIAAGRLRLAELLDLPAMVLRLDEPALLSDPALAAADPTLESVVNVNTPQDYAAALQRPAPTVTADGRRIRAATVAEAAAECRLPLGAGTTVWLNGARVDPDGELPLVAGDAVVFGP
jgi:molybdopterin-guanine dinucleotide biosynthesis protein A